VNEHAPRQKRRAVAGQPLLEDDGLEKFNATAFVATTLQLGFTEAGGREAYLVVSLADAPLEPFVIVPVPMGRDAASFSRALRSALRGECEPLGEAVFCGPPATLERLKKTTRRRPPLKAEELVKAFQSAGGEAVQAVFLMSDDQRRVVNEMYPRLPPQLGGGSTEAFSKGLDFAALGLTVSAKPAIRFVLQAKDAGSAEAQSATIAKGLEWFAKSAEVRKHLPAAEKVARALTPRTSGNQVVVELSEEQKGFSSLISIAESRSRADRERTARKLKEIGLALNVYDDLKGSFPARANFDAAGKPLLSWRVHVLPYLDQEALYKEFRLDEPWDSEHNKKLVVRMPEVFRAAGSEHKRESGRTTFLAPLCQGSVLGTDKATKLADIKDGTSYTIAVVEAADAIAVIWTRPDDWQVDDKDPVKGLGEKFAALFCDASVRFFKRDIAAETLRGLLTASGNEEVNP
jgi:hypothetical protein